MDSERARIGYRVVYADEFDRENARLYGVARLNAVEHRRNIIVELAELALEHAECKTRCVYRDMQITQHVGQCADVVLVSVCDEYSAYLFLVLFEVADIRDNEVYTEHIVVGKAETAVYYDNVVARLDNGDILAYLAETAEHRDSYLTLFRVLLRGALLLAARAGCLVGQLLAALDPALRVRAFSSCISSRCSHCVVSVICSCHVVSRYSLGAAALLSFLCSY